MLLGRWQHSSLSLLRMSMKRDLFTEVSIRVHAARGVAGCCSHCGDADLHLGNVLLHLPSSLNSLSEEQLYERYGAPEPEPVVRLDGAPLGLGVPSHAIPPIWFGKWCEKIALSDAKLLLTDFGVAFRPSTEVRCESYAPLEIRPPETRFQPSTPLSFPSHIWSLGCTIWVLISHRSLFDVFFATADEVAADQVDLLGRWWEQWEGRAKQFDETGKAIEDRCVWSWERRFEKWVQQPRRDKKMATLDEREKRAFEAMMRLMLRFRPEHRPNAKEVLQTEWMREWALPAWEKVRTRDTHQSARCGQ